MADKYLRYTDTHEWARAEPTGGMVTVGITDYAIEQLGDIVYLELPKIADKVNKGVPFGTIESVKAASDLYSPLSGEIVEVNEALPDKLDLFKADPYGQSWMVKIKPDNSTQFESLMDAAAYEEYVKGL